MSYEVQSFEEDVLAASHARPVLVDFWAPWCGPCRTLGPVLEKLAAEQADRWTLVKINTDVHQEVSVQYGIRGIPAVKLFVDGQVVDEFTGALPEYAVQQWLDKALPSENKQLLQQAEEALLMDQRTQAAALLEQVVVAEPNNAQARALLGSLVVFSDPDRASALVAAAPTAEPRYAQLGQAVQTIARLLQLDAAALPDADGATAYREALDAVRAQDFDTALDRLIQVLMKNRYYDEDGARKAGIALFNLLGPDHAVTRKHRRTFDMWLY